MYVHVVYTICLLVVSCQFFFVNFYLTELMLISLLLLFHAVTRILQSRQKSLCDTAFLKRCPIFEICPEQRYETDSFRRVGIEPTTAIGLYRYRLRQNSVWLRHNGFNCLSFINYFVINIQFK